MARHSCCHYVSLIACCIGVAAGLLGSICFSVFYHNYPAVVYAFMSAVLAAVTLMLIILHHRHVLEVWHSSETLSNISTLGMYFALFGIISVSSYISFGLIHHKGIMPIDDNPYITAVWAFMLSKWGLTLWLCSRKYSQLLNSGSLLGD